MSGDDDVAIDDPSSSAEDGSDAGSLIDASPPSDPGSPVLGALRPAGRQYTASQPLATAPPGPDPSPGSSARRDGVQAPDPAPIPQHLLTPRPGPVAEPRVSPVPVEVSPGGPAAGDAEAGERMDTGADGEGGGSGGSPAGGDPAPEGDSDVEILPAEDAEPAPAAAGPAARRSLGSSSVWRETDFQEPGRGRQAAPEEPAAAASSTADDASAAAGPTEEHKTPAKAEGGGEGSAAINNKTLHMQPCCAMNSLIFNCGGIVLKTVFGKHCM